MPGQESQVLVQEIPGSLQPQLPQVTHRMPSNGFTEKAGRRRKTNHPSLQLLLSKLCSCEEKSSQSCFPAGLAPACADAWVTPPQVQDPAFVFAEFQNFMFCPFLQPVRILLNGSTTLCTEQLAATFEVVPSSKRFPSSRLAVF